MAWRSWSALVLPAVLLSLPLDSSRAQTGWIAQSSPVSTHLRGVDFVTSAEGWVCGDAGVILHTTDGGGHWVRQFSGTARDLFAISFADAQVGFVVGEASAVLRTTDGGLFWSVSDLGDAYPNNSVHALDSRHVWIAGTHSGPYGSRAWVYWSDDGGVTWNGRGLGSDAPDWSGQGTGISMTSALTVFVTGTSLYEDYPGGSVFKTTDGGATFNEVYFDAGPMGVCTGVQFVSPSDGFVITGQMIRTTDGGTNWEWCEQWVWDAHMSFVTSSIGWVVGRAGEIRRTDNSGDIWVDQASGTIQTLFGVDFVDLSNGTAVGANGTILHTITGGQDGAGLAESEPVGRPRFLCACPNPFSDRLRIAFEVAEPCGIDLEIFDPSGRLLRRLSEGPSVGGGREAWWDGTDEAGRPAASGVYFIRLTGAGAGSSRSVRIVR